MPMHQKFVETDSSFARQIMKRGGPPAMKKASGQWLESAEMDLGSIDQIIQRQDLTPVAAFHSQQCVETAPQRQAHARGSTTVLPFRAESL